MKAERNSVYGGCTDQRKIGYKIRETRLARVPYMLVVGEKEQSEGQGIGQKPIPRRRRAEGSAGIYRCDSGRKSARKRSVRLR